jgi:transcription-repair coupling factor (superfamily II helicase)
MRDLEIRGAGNILGAEQHGHMGAVGYELYCKMLREAMSELKDEPVEATFETTMRIRVDAYIPASYIANEAQKLEVYKKIAAISCEEDYLDMQEELIDRYSDMPACVGNLLDISFIKALAAHLGIDLVEEDGFSLTLHFRADAPVDPMKLLSAVTEMGRGARLIPTNDSVRVLIPFHTETVEKDSVRLVRLRRIMDRLQEIHVPEEKNHEA